MKRVFTADVFNRVANDPAVRPWLGGIANDVLDLSWLVTNPLNVAWQGGHGGFIAQQTEPGLYEIHSLLTEAGRGSAAYEGLSDLLVYLFTRTNALDVVTKVPDGNLAALGLCRLVGAVKRFTTIATFVHPDGRKNLTAYGLTCEEWTLKSPLTLRAGQAFHHQIEDEKILAGATSPIHDDDPTHEHLAGFACLCIQGGNAAKGVHLYNRWARLAGYAEIALISEHPAVIDIQDAIGSFAPDGKLEVLTCR